MCYIKASLVALLIQSIDNALKENSRQKKKLTNECNYILIKPLNVLNVLEFSLSMPSKRFIGLLNMLDLNYIYINVYQIQFGCIALEAPNQIQTIDLLALQKKVNAWINKPSPPARAKPERQK